MILIGLAAALAQADEPWKEYANKNGVTFEKRQASDSKFYEYRATTLVQAPVQAVIDAIWLGVTGSIPPTVKKRAVLSKTDTEYLVYDQIKAPVVSDRDVTIKIRKMARGDGIGEIGGPVIEEIMHGSAPRSSSR